MYSSIGLSSDDVSALHVLLLQMNAEYQDKVTSVLSLGFVCQSTVYLIISVTKGWLWGEGSGVTGLVTALTESVFLFHFPGNARSVWSARPSWYRWLICKLMLNENT